jgi:hypothetical protein
MFFLKKEVDSSKVLISAVTTKMVHPKNCVGRD